MIYIDPPRFYAGKMKRYSHMMADDLQELHEFAATLGIGRHFFHRDHYDVNEHQFHAAIIYGAQVVRPRELIPFRKK